MYIVYKTTNIVNKKFYIGVHRTPQELDLYLGSGLILRLAVSKYGRENFVRETLFVFDCKVDAYNKERELVDPTDPMSMNLRNGGDGGFEWVTPLMRQKGGFATAKQLTEEQRAHRDERLRLGRSLSPLHKKGWHHTEEVKERMSHAHLGVKKSEETRTKMSVARKGAKLSDEHRLKLTGSREPLSEGTKRKMSTDWGAKRIKVQCSNCGNEFFPHNIKQHRNKCEATSANQ